MSNGPDTVVSPQTLPAEPDDEFIDGDQMDDTQPLAPDEHPLTPYQVQRREACHR